MGALGLLLAAGSAQAQLYHYKDTNGRMVYSDTPPPPNIPAANILKSPKTNQASPAPGAAATADGKDGKKDSPKSTAEREADYKKRTADAGKKGQEDAQKAKAEEARQQLCASNQANLTAMQGGQRVRKFDASGNPYFIDDNERAADVAKTQQTLADNKCS